ncbi:hypothetical protein PHSC3_001879 [Chlamydiales bacterium STE3]|nr:hypothetical protein PHSC3_001879 [Chlamydiales bacterium STE3]
MGMFFERKDGGFLGKRGQAPKKRLVLPSSITWNDVRRGKNLSRVPGCVSYRVLGSFFDFLVGLFFEYI